MKTIIITLNSGKAKVILKGECKVSFISHNNDRVIKDIHDIPNSSAFFEYCWSQIDTTNYIICNKSSQITFNGTSVENIQINN